ncbi:conserved membrane hypothetical protein [uncultured Desulfobacterium sp.]|uniref:TVP38/TMEM64 family membrane protein n=1 Tax=uncultured Desulfobacterium sp. TaxID=201089 RepID=A0A445MS37_9BACT|nr:conserved membrane hypothetical protein [uncultured Desulfobacterium sp.]
MKKQSDQNLVKDILIILLTTLFFAAVSWVISLPSVRQEAFDVTKWQAYLRGDQWYSALTFILCLILANGCGFPRLWVCVIVGAVFGAHLGVWISQIISLCGATLNFFVGRWLLKSPFNRRIPERFRGWYDRFGDNGFYWVLNIRLFPLGNATVTSLMSGASKMAYSSFIAATFIGFLPLTIIFALFGSSASHHKPLQLYAGAVLFLLFEGVRRIYKKRSLKRQDPNLQLGEV